MTSLEDLPDSDFRFFRGLSGYLAAVSTAVGVGAESCTVDTDLPVSAYIALDERWGQLRDRDLALLWDERYGWAVATETHAGEDLVVLDYLGGTIVPEPQRLKKFVRSLRSGVRVIRPSPPALRSSGDHEVLGARLRLYLAPS